MNFAVGFFNDILLYVLISTIRSTSAAEPLKYVYILFLINIVWNILTHLMQFILPFLLIIRNGFPIALLVVYYMGRVIGVWFALYILVHWDPKKTLIGIFIFFTLFTVLAILARSSWFFALDLFGIGFVDTLSVAIWTRQISFGSDEQKINEIGDPSVKKKYIIFAAVNVVIKCIWGVILILIDKFANEWIIVGFYSFILILIFLLRQISIRKGIFQLLTFTPLPQTRHNFTFITGFSGIKLIFGFMFFWGFFTTIIHYVIMIFLLNQGFQSKIHLFLCILMISFALFAIIAGFLAHKIGRKITFLLGLSIQACSFLFLILLNVNEIAVIYLFPIILGLGLALCYVPESVFNNELGAHIPDEYMVYKGIYTFILMSSGCLFGIIFGEAMKGIFFGNPAYLTIILLLIVVLFMFIASQIRETRPTEEEIEWKKAVKYIYVINKSGIPIFSQNLTDLSGSSPQPDETLLGGALIGISSILKEIAQDQIPLEILKKENFCILFEEGTHVIAAIITDKDIPIIRNKLKTFLHEFQDFFDEYLCKAVVDMNLFIPAKKIVKKIF